MSVATLGESTITQIGETAGLVWRLLDEEGPMSITRLTKTIDAPRDLVLQSIGWLAREDKLLFEETSRGKLVSILR